MRPYADNTFYIIGMKKGWFEDVGIKFDPAPYGLKANDSNVTTLLLNGQLDIISEFCPLMLPTYKDAAKLKCIAFTDNFLANAILANPALKLKTFKDYIAEGKSFDEALKAALAPMEGKTLVGAPELSDRPFEEYRQQDVATPASSCRCSTTRSRSCWPRRAARISSILRARRSSTRCARRAGPISSTSTISSNTAPAASIPRSSRSSASSASAATPTISTPSEHRSALPVGRLAHHRRHQERPLAL